MSTPTIVITGNNYSSLSTFYYLCKLSQKGRIQYEIIFITEDPTIYNEATLHESLTESISINDLGQEIHALTYVRPNISILYDGIKEVDFDNSSIKTSRKELKYNFLVYGDSKKTSSEIKGSNVFETTSIKDYLRLKAHINSTLQKSIKEESEEIKKSLLNFCILGNSEKAVSLAFLIEDYSTELIKKHYPSISYHYKNVSIIAKEKSLALSKNQDFSREVLNHISKQNISLKLNIEIDRIVNDRIQTKNSGEFYSSTIINSDYYSHELPSKLNSAELKTDDYFRLKSYNNVYIITPNEIETRTQGFSSLLESERNISLLTAKNIFNSINEEPLSKETPPNKVRFILLSKKSALLQYKEHLISGGFAWAAYKFFSAYFTPGLKMKIAIICSTILDMFNLRATDLTHTLFKPPNSQESKAKSSTKASIN